MSIATKTLPALALLALLGGCVKFGSNPPPSLLTLDSAAQTPVGQVRSSGSSPTIVVDVPSVSQELAVQRVPVRATDTSIAYIKDAQWVEPPAQLFATLLGDTISARTGHVVLGSSQSAIVPGEELAGSLRDFGIDAASKEAVVTYDAALMHSSPQSVEKRRFQARVPVNTIDAADAGRALNQAANQVATQVADWIGK